MTNILIKIAAVVALLVVLFVGEQYIERRGYDRAMSEAQAQIEGSKRAAADRLALEIQKTRQAEQALQAFKNTQELNDANHQKAVADMSRRLRDLAGPSGRLRDPHAARCGAGGSGTPGAVAATPGDRAADPAEAGGLLSVPLSDLLSETLQESDDINNAYASCRADAYTVRELLHDRSLATD